MNEKKKCVIYCRVSSREQEESGYSLDAQEKLLTEYANKKENNWAVARVFRVSESASGAKQRETFNQMIDFIKRNKIKILVCEKTDRLTRNRKDAVIVDEWVRQDSENQTHFVKENFVLTMDSRANEKFIWGIKVEVAQYYTNNLSEEVKKGQKEKLAQGWLPTKPPLGYKTIGDAGHKIHIIDEKTAPFIRKAFEMYATGNQTIRSLRAFLAKEGLRTRTGAKLSRSQLENILRDPFYMGSIRWNDVVYNNGKHEPLVSKELFNAVQDKLTRKLAPHYKRRVHKFSKLLKCKECGGTISAEIQKGHVYYSCKHNRNTPCTQKGMTKEEKVEGMLIGVFDFFATITAEEAEQVRTVLMQNHKVEAEYKQNTLNALETRYNALQKRLDILYNDRLAENIGEEMWKKKQGEIDLEQKEIREQVEIIKSKETQYFELYINILDLAFRARKIYEKRTPEQRRLLLSKLFSNITLKDQNTEYELRSPVKVLAKRIDQKIEVEKIFEPTQKTAETLSLSGDLQNASNNSSLESSEVQNNNRTSRKPSVKPRPEASDLASRPLLRG